MIYLLARRLFISFHLHFLRLFDPALNDACLVFEDCWWISLFVSTRMEGKGPDFDFEYECMRRDDGRVTLI